MSISSTISWEMRNLKTIPEYHITGMARQDQEKTKKEEIP